MTDFIKLAWLVANPTSEPRVSRKQLLDAVHFSGRNPSKKDMMVCFEKVVSNQKDFCEKRDSFTFEDFTRICKTVRFVLHKVIRTAPARVAERSVEGI